MKKILSSFLIACACLSVWGQTGSGTVEDPWQLTETMTAVLDDDGTLKICGTGDMPDRRSNAAIAFRASESGAKPYMLHAETDYGPFFSFPEDTIDKVKAVIISEGVTSIGGCAFYGCHGLKSVTIPDSVTNIGECVFWECSALISVSIPKNVTHIGGCAFQDCSGLTSVTLSEGVTHVGVAAFLGCSGLVSVTLPSSVTNIETGVFRGCTGLTSIVIPRDVTNIESGAFAGCGGLKDVYFSGVVPPLVVSDAFSSCNADLILHAPPGWTGRTRILGGVYLAVDGEIMGVQQVNMTVTNVVVNYVLNSVQPEFANPPTADTGFVNIITEVKGGAVAVPSSWAENYPAFESKFGSDFTQALSMKTGKKDGAGNDMFVWQDYVAGTDPTKPEDKFTASITVVDGKVTVSYTPELDDDRKALRKYTTWGKKSLLDANWTVVQEGQEAEYNFFKVSVEMK